jgi:hypothetical protein
MRFTAAIVALSLFIAVFAAPVPAPVAEAEAVALPESIAEGPESIVARDADAEPCTMNYASGTCY